MNRSIEQALLSLLPTHNTNLPQPLVDLASSLLAQSRHRASTLKAEEEIARTYACAHLACDRLKITLNLPPIDPRPPIPPRIYKRLYSHLSNILPSTSSTPGRGGGTPRKLEQQSTTTTPRSQRTIKTPTSRLRDQANRDDDLTASPSAGRSARSTRSAATGTGARTTPGIAGKGKEKPLHQFRGTLFPRKEGGNGGDGGGLPDWMKPTLRLLLKELGPVHIGPVVMSGVESIVAPRGQRTEDEWVNANLVSLLGALYLFVWRGVTWPGSDIDEGEYVAMRKKVAAALKKARENVKVAVKLGNGKEEEQDEEKVWEGWVGDGVRLKDLDMATLHIGREGWLEMDWAAGVEDLARTVLEREDYDEAAEDGQGANKVELVRVGQGGSMFQDRYDYLGERKQREYAIWKQGILRKIKALENPSASTTATPRKRKVPEANMDIDEDE